MLKQLKQAVSSAVAADPLKDYALDESTAMKVGRGNVFVVYAAVLRATGQPVSVFMLPLKELSARCGSAAEMTYVVDAVRRGVAQLAQLRHPRILRVEHGLVEDKKRLWYATERVVDAVSLLLPLQDMPTQMKVLELRQCGEAMRFVHERADVLLGNFAPHALYVTTGGQWKLGDLTHALPRSELASLSSSSSSSSSLLAPFTFRSVGAPLLDYMAYEFIDHIVAAYAHHHDDSSHRGSSGSSSSSNAHRRHRPGSTAVAQHVDAMSDLFDTRDTTAATGGARTTTATAGNDVAASATAVATLQPSPPLVFPDSDVFAFVLVAVEVLASRRLFSCLGDAAQQARQRGDVEATVAQYFAPGTTRSVLQLPRPSLSSVLTSGPFATPDVQLLLSLETYDTLDARERFALLRGIYNGLAAGLFCEAVVVRYIVPRMKREGQQQQQQQQSPSQQQPAQDMMRYTLPVLLQCAATLSTAAFDAHLREYFTALIAAMCRAPALDARMQVLAQQMLEKYAALARHFAERVRDVNATVLPLVLKCLACTDTTSSSSSSSNNAAGNMALTRLALEALYSVLQRHGGAALHVGVAVSNNSSYNSNNTSNVAGGDATSASTTSRIVVPVYVVDVLIRVAARPGGTRLVRALDCLDVLLPRLSLAAREGAEEALLRVLCSLVADNNADADDAAVADASAGGAFVRRMLAMLQALQAAMSAEHVATCTIPRVSPLLLSRHGAVRQYAVQCIVQCAQRFGDGSSNNTTVSSSHPVQTQPRTTNDDLLAAFGLT